jgi:hypothetical protein
MAIILQSVNLIIEDSYIVGVAGNDLRNITGLYEIKKG